MAKLRILLGDDHTLLRQGLRKILEERTRVGGRRARPATAATRCAKRWPCSPTSRSSTSACRCMNGIEATRQIVRRSPDLRVLILSMHVERGLHHPGAQGRREGLPAEGLRRHRADSRRRGGGRAASRSSAPPSPKSMLDDYVRHLAEKGIADRYDSLSEREREMFQLVAEGHSNKEIAELLSVSPATIETHRAHILQKLDVHNTAELVLYAVRRGVIS